MYTLRVISKNWVSTGQESKTLLFFKWVGGRVVVVWVGGGEGRECQEVKRLSNISSSLHRSHFLSAALRVMQINAALFFLNHCCSCVLFKNQVRRFKLEA